MNSAATEHDLDEYLQQTKLDIVQKLIAGQTAIISKMARQHMVRSSTGVLQGAQKLEEILSEALASEFDNAFNWVGPYLPENVVRAKFAEFGRQMCEEAITPSRIYRSHPVGAGTVETLKNSMLSRVRKFELAANGNNRSFPGATYNIIKATSIVGGIQQGQGHLKQENTVTLSTGEIQSAIDRLRSVLEQFGPDDLLPKVDDDLRTIEAQLRKEQPNVTIVQEAGKSVRTIMEGAVGGMLSQPLAHALANVAVALGLG